MSRDHLHTCSILGAFFAANPVKDGVILYHSPAGCEKMVLHAACSHDLLGFERDRLELCQVGNPEAVFGGEDKLRASVKRLLADRPGRHVFVTSSCAPEIIGDDLAGVLRSLGSPRVTLLGGAGFRGDLWQGFSDALALMVESLVPEKARRRPSGDRVNVLGYLCDRLEHDHLANIRVITGMLSGLGLEVNTFLSGPTDTRQLRKSWDAGRNIAFDFGDKAADALAGRCGQEKVRVDYPIGLGGTAAFLRGAGRAVGRERKAEALISAGLRSAVPLIEAGRGTCRCKRVGVSADSQRLPGLVEFLLDLGMIPAWVQVLDEGRDVLPRLKAVLAGRCEKARINPSPEQVRRMLPETDLLVGSHVEKYRYGRRVPVYESTYPCLDRHALSEEPDSGFEGAVRLANNLANLLRMRNTRLFGLDDELNRLGFEERFHFRRL
ncbi:MAG: nitrogenase component 1 [Elusimicrobia bacterium]|nr:nitrogenase component 1 [Elusimicrobiota bacterium]